jgi:serine O-acetyltransferase
MALNNENSARQTKKNSWDELKYLWYTDLYRYIGKAGTKRTYIYLLLRNLGYRYIFLMRLCYYLSHNKKTIFRRIILRFFLELLRHYTIRLGVSIPHYTEIGSGLFLPHPNSIVVNSLAVIGKNCTICHGVTIGSANRGKKKGCPVIGDEVYISPGAVIIGKVKVGNGVIIGANSVVSEDLPDNAVTAGNPSVIISFDGSRGYINRIDY